MTYSIIPADNLGAMSEEHARRGISALDVDAWLDAHEDVGTYIIIDDADGKPACLHPFGLAGGALACDCGRPECPDAACPSEHGRDGR